MCEKDDIVEKRKYRQYLVETSQKISESYDKTIITLSSGTLALSFTFIKNFIEEKQISHSELLFLSWALLAISLGAVVFSLFFASLAYRKAIEQIDKNTIHNNKVGGSYTTITNLLHSSAAILLILGIFTLGSFVYFNLGENEMSTERKTQVPPPPPPPPEPSRDVR